MQKRPQILVGDVVRISHRALRRGKYTGWINRTFVVAKVAGDGISYSTKVQCVIDYDCHVNHTFYRSDLYRVGHNVLAPIKCDECGYDIHNGHGILCSHNTHCGYCGAHSTWGTHRAGCSRPMYIGGVSEQAYLKLDSIARHRLYLMRYHYWECCGQPKAGQHTSNCSQVTIVRFSKTPAAPMPTPVYEKFQDGIVDALGKCYWHGTTDCEHLKA